MRATLVVINVAGKCFFVIFYCVVTFYLFKKKGGLIIIKEYYLRIIRILMHGLKNNVDFTKQDINLSPNEYELGKGTKWEGIFNKNYGIKKASIIGFFNFNGKELIIERKFEKKLYKHFIKQPFIKEIIVNYPSKGTRIYE